MQVHGTFFWLLVPWSEVPDHLVEEMVKYLKAMFRGNQDPAKEPSTHLIKQRIKGYYRAQRQQKITASSPTRRRRRRFQNRKNRLTMVRYLKVRLAGSGTIEVTHTQ